MIKKVPGREKIKVERRKLFDLQCDVLVNSFIR